MDNSPLAPRDPGGGGGALALSDESIRFAHCQLLDDLDAVFDATTAAGATAAAAAAAAAAAFIYLNCTRTAQCCWQERVDTVRCGSERASYYVVGADIAITLSRCMYCVWGRGVCKDNKTKTPNRNELKLGTVVVLDSLSKPIDFGFKRVKGQGHRVR